MKDLVYLYTEAKKSLPEISKILGIPTSTVRRKLLRLGVRLRTRTEGIRLSPNMGNGRRGKKFIFTEEHKRNMSIAHRKYLEKSGKVKGYTKKPSGYIEYTSGENRGRGQHRVLMEEILGRKLGFDEIVHHINGDRADNRLENLQLLSRAEHSRYHLNKRRNTL